MDEAAILFDGSKFDGSKPRTFFMRDSLWSDVCGYCGHFYSNHCPECALPDCTCKEFVS